MRYRILTLGIALGIAPIALYQGWVPRATDQVASMALSDEAQLAIEVRCEGREGKAGTKCRRLLQKLYLAGSLDPERALRHHCTAVGPVELGHRPSAPPTLCVQRYGGWQRG